MTRYLALLRGINVGGNHRVPMVDLRAVVSAVGYSDVSTFIQSGNIVFTAADALTPVDLQTALAEQFGFEIAVILRTAHELRAAVEANPFVGAAPTTLHVGFMAEEPSGAVVASLDTARFEPDQCVIHGRQLYLHTANGMGRAKLPAYLDRHLKVPTTARNWNTVTKLLDLVCIRGVAESAPPMHTSVQGGAGRPTGWIEVGGGSGPRPPPTPPPARR